MSNPNDNNPFYNFSQPGSSSNPEQNSSNNPNYWLQFSQDPMFNQWAAQKYQESMNRVNPFVQQPNQWSQFSNQPNQFTQYAQQRPTFTESLQQQNQSTQQSRQFTSLRDEEAEEIRSAAQEESRAESDTPTIIVRKDHKKKKEKAAQREHHSKRHWTPSEEVWLATCWYDISFDCKIGNSQSSDTFWGSIRKMFNDNESGWKRGDDQLSSKWRTMDKDCKAFEGFYKGVERAPRQSGRNDNDIYEQAVSQFQQVSGRWNYRHVWEFLRVKPKWSVKSAISGRRRPAQMELYDDDDEEEENVAYNLGEDRQTNFEEVLRSDTIRRPMGRDRAKKSAKSSASSDAGGSSRGTTGSRVDELVSRWDVFKDAEVETMNKGIEAIVAEERKRTEEERKRTAMEYVNKICTLDIDSIRDPKARKRAMKLKEKMEADLKDLLGDSSDDE